MSSSIFEWVDSQSNLTCLRISKTESLLKSGTELGGAGHNELVDDYNT